MNLLRINYGYKIDYDMVNMVYMNCQGFFGSRVFDQYKFYL